MTNGFHAIAIAGPTASGKTAAALAVAAHLAPRFPVEIVSVDSALVYRGMDIGTAKPTAAERGAVPHHLIDIRDPLQPYSAAEFAADATRLVADIRARGALPLLVGGTMLYLRALLYGIDAMPPAHAATRAVLEAEAAATGWPAMHAQLAQADPVTASRLSPNDSQRIQRALEVWRTSGRPISSFQSDATDSIAARAGLAGTVAVFSLEPADRAWLHARIAERFGAMLDAGFLDEVRGLHARGDLHPDLPAMRCVGYRQAWDHLDGSIDHATFVERGMAATRQLAKRQITWLRGMPPGDPTPARSGTRHTVACDAPDAVAQLLAAVDRLPLAEAGAP